MGAALSVRSVRDLGDDEEPHVQSNQLLLHSSARWFQHSFYLDSTTAICNVSSARVNYSASAACDECSGSRHKTVHPDSNSATVRPL